MKRLHTFGLHQQALAGLLRELLEREGIACLVRNEQLFAALGEVPFTECFPELWVVDDECYPRGQALLRQVLAEPDAATASWTCPGCGESSEGQFDACWHCGWEREAGGGD